MRLQTKFAVLLTTAVLFGAIIGYTLNAIANPVSPTVYLDDLPAQAIYTVKSDGSNFWCIRYDGFKGEESADYATTINWAITTTNSMGGGKVFLDVIGEYTINTPVLMKAKVTLQGLGMYVTSLKAKNALNDAVIKTESSVTAYVGVAIMDLGVNGNKANQANPSYPTILPDGIRLYDCTDPVVQRCYVHDVMEYGMWILGQGVSNGVKGGEVSSCAIIDCVWAGMVIGGSGGNGDQLYARVVGNYVNGGDDVGISIQTSHCEVQGNTVANQQNNAYGGGGASGGAYGIDVEATHSHFNEIGGNTIFYCDIGIGLMSAENTIVGGFIDDVDMQALSFSGTANNCSVIGVKVTNSANLVYMGGTCSYNDVKNCICQDSSAQAIKIENANCIGNFIDGCDLKGCNSNTYDIGTGTVYGWNRWKDGTYKQGAP